MHLVDLEFSEELKQSDHGKITGGNDIVDQSVEVDITSEADVNAVEANVSSFETDIDFSTLEFDVDISIDSNLNLDDAMVVTDPCWRLGFGWGD